MGDEFLHAEQAIFLVQPQTKGAVLRLEMSGGEFCSNAVLSAVAYCSYKELVKDHTYLLEISGLDFPLECK